MISAGDFRNGATFESEGNVYQIVEFQHVKPGKGAAFVRTKIRNVINGGIVEKTFRPTDKFEKAQIERRDADYSYNDGSLYYFMEHESYEQIPIGNDVLGDALNYLKENMTVKILSYKGNVFGIEMPLSVDLQITSTEPGIKGNTAQGATKPATLETGITINVPLFIDEGEVIRVSTATGEYLERA